MPSSGITHSHKFSFPPVNNTNYHQWAQSMEAYLHTIGAWRCMQPSYLSAHDGKELDDYLDKLEAATVEDKTSQYQKM
jgi:hypothetical protein